MSARDDRLSLEWIARMVGVPAESDPREVVDAVRKMCADRVTSEHALKDENRLLAFDLKEALQKLERASAKPVEDVPLFRESGGPVDPASDGSGGSIPPPPPAESSS